MDFTFLLLWSFRGQHPAQEARCFAEGYLADKLTEHSVVISKAEGLALLRKRGYIFKDELAVESG